MFKSVLTVPIFKNGLCKGTNIFKTLTHRQEGGMFLLRKCTQTCKSIPDGEEDHSYSSTKKYKECRSLGAKRRELKKEAAKKST